LDTTVAIMARLHAMLPAIALMLVAVCMQCTGTAAARRLQDQQLQPSLQQVVNRKLLGPGADGAMRKLLQEDGGETDGDGRKLLQGGDETDGDETGGDGRKLLQKTEPKTPKEPKDPKESDGPKFPGEGGDDAATDSDKRKL